MINQSRPGDEESQPHRETDITSIEELNAVTVGNAIISQPEESTPLLRATDTTQKKRARIMEDPKQADCSLGEWKSRFRHWVSTPSDQLADIGCSIRRLGSLEVGDIKKFRNVVAEPISCLPAVLLGLLLNVLDALSYGMILFPLGQSVFSELAPDGLSMFYVSCIVSQLVYSLGGSIFKGGIGSEMIEGQPHSLVRFPLLAPTTHSPTIALEWGKLTMGGAVQWYHFSTRWHLRSWGQSAKINRRQSSPQRFFPIL